jgi:hypothetical protein
MLRVGFDDDIIDFSLAILQEPSWSSHWLGLDHQEGDRLIHNMEELKEAFASALIEKGTGETVALWSCVVGYAEALSTHTVQRYHIFPIPLGGAATPH